MFANRAANVKLGIRPSLLNLWPDFLQKPPQTIHIGVMTRPDKQHTTFIWGGDTIHGFKWHGERQHVLFRERLFEFIRIIFVNGEQHICPL